MFIHWFPGHMTKALRMMEKETALCDSIIYVLDARAPLSSINPRFDDVIGVKPRLYILNKADLVDKKELAKWAAYFEEKGYCCVTANSSGKTDSAAVIKGLLTVNAPLIERYANKGVRKTVRAMVIGIPNCGKSTLINSLTKEKRAATGNRPGVTRGKQWVSIDKYIDLLDSPGVLYPDFSDQKKALRLALIGSIKEDVLDITELALEAAELFRTEEPGILAKRYGMETESGDIISVLTSIGKARGCMLKGGEVDLERAARAFINDFRKGAFGKIILEKL